jgi:hypothetical protein
MRMFDDGIISSLFFILWIYYFWVNLYEFIYVFNQYKLIEQSIKWIKWNKL